MAPGSAKVVPGRGRKEASSRKLRRRAEREAKKARRTASQRGGRGNRTGESLLSQGAGRARGGQAASLRSNCDGFQARPEEKGGRQKMGVRGRQGERGEGEGQEGERMRARQTAEEREMGRLERKLGMKKKKSLPVAFREDGLDYLLNLTQSWSDQWDDWPEEDPGIGTDPGKDENEEEEEEALERDTKPHERDAKPHKTHKRDVEPCRRDGKPHWRDTKPLERDARFHKSNDMQTERAETVKPYLSGKRARSGPVTVVSSAKRARLENVDVEENESSGLSESSESGEVSDGYLDDSDGDSEQDDSSLSSEREEGERGEGPYQPPHVRNRAESERERGAQPTDMKLLRTLQGLVNRLNESNIQPIATQLERMYVDNSRNDMNSCLAEVLLKACVSPAPLSERFCMVHVMVVAILHNNVGSEVGAYLVQRVAQKLDSLLSQRPNYGQGKECDCVLLVMAHLYTFKVVHCVIIYDIIRKLVASFTERDVELLLLLLKNTGMDIRRDDAASLKDIILQIQSKAAASPSLKESSRTRFMLETIAALKTNNSRKIPNYDPSLLEHMRRLTRALVHSRGPADENQLKISLNDLLKADQQGRWWVVGSAWTGRESAIAPASSQSPLAESWVLDLARKQRMNTEVRRNIFCILMTSEDCVDAFEKLLRLGLKEKQEREIVHVLIDCCLQEKKFNPFYAYLGQKFCEFSRTHQVTFQYSLWDRLKVLSEVTSFGRANLRQLLAHLVLSQALSLSVLRVVEFTELTSPEEVKFHKKLLHTILLHCTDSTCKAVFSRISAQPHLKSFRDSLLVFMKHHLSLSAAPSSSFPLSLSPSLSPSLSQHSSTAEEEKALETRLELVEKIMRTQQPIV